MARHRLFLVLSDYLTKQGIAVLRFDDRGFGGSTGDFDQATTADFAKDVGGNFFKVFGKVLGFAFVFGAIIGIIVLFSLTFGTFNFYTDQGNFESVNLHEFTGILFQTKIDSFLAWTGVFLTSIVPIIAMLVFGIQLIAEIKSKHANIFKVKYSSGYSCI